MNAGCSSVDGLAFVDRLQPRLDERGRLRDRMPRCLDALLGFPFRGSHFYRKLCGASAQSNFGCETTAPA